MLQPVDHYIKTNKRFNNDNPLYGHFVPTPVRYRSEQVRPIDQVNTWHHQQLITQQSTGFIGKSQLGKFVPPLMQASRSSVSHNNEYVSVDKHNTPQENNRTMNTSNGKVAFKGNDKTWMTTTRGDLSRGPFIKKSNTSMADNHSVSRLTVASPRPLLGAPNTDDLVMSNLVIKENHKVFPSNMRFRLYGTSDEEKMFIFTGTVERVIKWNRIFCNQVCYFEVIATVLSIEEGSVKSQMVMLLRDKKGGPILQMVYYTITHLALQDFYIGQMLRCVGKMNGRNIFNAVSIRAATPEEVENLHRLCCVCDQAVSQHYLKV